MRKTFVLFTFIFLSLFLAACNTKPNLDELIQNDTLKLPSEVTNDLTLPVSLTLEGTTFSIVWNSSHPQLISNTGNVNRPTHETGDVEVTLVATFKNGDFTKPITFKVTLKAIPEAGFLVVFDSNGGSSVNYQKVLQGGKVTKPTDPTRVNFTFGGWYQDYLFAEAFNFDTDTIQSYTVLYAKWIPIQHTVTFDSNGGSAVESQMVFQTGKAKEPTAPTRAGFTFGGWYLESALTTPWVFGTNTVTEDITLYAKWTELAVYTVTFENADGTVLTTQSVQSGSKATAPTTNPTKPGYTFIGWLKQEVVFDLNTNITANTTLKPNFEIIEYTITYNIPEDAILSVDGDALFTIITSPTLKTVTLENMTFLGWFTALEGSDKVESIPVGTMGNQTLYARFEPTVELPEGTLLYTKEDVVALITNGATGQVHLMNDIDMTGVALTGSAQNFGGILDGHGFTIRGAVINASANKMGFLFKEVLNGAIIRNINFADSIHNGGGSSESSAFIAAFAQGGSRFENIQFYNVSVIHAGSYAALLFGDVINDATETTITIRNITVINDDAHWIEGSSYVGGLIGAARKVVTIDIENVYFDSKVAAPNQAAGAIMGRLNAAGITLSVKQAVIKGSVSSGKNVGAILGTNISGSTVIANYVFISDIIQTSGTNTNRIGVGNSPSGSTSTLTNLFYNNETTQFFVTTNSIAVPEGTGLASSAIDETWFNASGFNATFFKVIPGSIGRQSDENVPVEETGFTLGTAQVKKYYLVTEALDLTNLAVYQTFSDGSSVLLEVSEYTINSVAFNNAQTGTYEITVTYKGQSKSFTVEVVEITHIEANALMMKQTYMVGTSLNLDGLVVKAILSDGSSLKLNASDYTIDTTQVNFAVAGTYTIQITYKQFEVVTIIIHVHEIDAEVTSVESLYVDLNHTGADGDLVSGQKTFKSIKSALQFLVNQNYDSNIVKVLYIAEGVYREKITITVPNVIFIGENRDLTVITYNAASGTEQPNGGTWGTQGSATVSIKSAATGFMAKNLTFQNDFNFNGSTIADKQGVAMVNEADQVIFYQVNFKGYQDTLYAKSGRQYYLNVYIEGVVDFIFGNGGPAFFEQSTIHSLARSTGVISTNKGYNVSSTALIQYGYVFYQNTFTFENGVPAGSVDLGRPWDAKAAIAYIDNVFDVHISTRGWTEMSGNQPQNARFFEYQNKDVQLNLLNTTTNGQMLSSVEAADYINKVLVFGMTNGQVTFTSEWFYQNALTYLQSMSYNA